MPWDTPLDNPPLEQDWPAESSVRVRHAIEQPLRDDLGLPSDDWAIERIGESPRPADQARIEILENANGHITSAVDDLREALSWFSVVDRADHSEMVRQVEGLADTIGYRLRNARE